jgi:hypothetical protein
MSPAFDRSPPSRPRGSAELADDVRAIRTRLDRTIGDIENRLSPHRLPGAVVETVRGVLRDGGGGRALDALRANPLPLLLIGAGLVWLAVEVSRRPPRLEGRRVGDERPSTPSQRIRILLAGLIGTLRQGAERFRRAEALVGDPTFAPAIRRCAEHFEGVAERLTGELDRRGYALEPDSPVHPGWDEFDTAASRSRDPRSLMLALEDGTDSALVLVRDAVREETEAELRALLADQFRHLEIVRREVTTLREAVA